MRRLGSGAGCGVPRVCLASTPREAGGHRPGPTTGALPLCAGWTWTVTRRGKPAGNCPGRTVPQPQIPRWRARRRRDPSQDGPRPNHHPRACRRAAPLMSGGEDCSHLGLFGAARQQGLGCLTFESGIRAPRATRRSAEAGFVDLHSNATHSGHARLAMTGNRQAKRNF